MGPVPVYGGHLLGALLDCGRTGWASRPLTPPWDEDILLWCRVWEFLPPCTLFVVRRRGRSLTLLLLVPDRRGRRRRGKMLIAGLLPGSWGAEMLESMGFPLSASRLFWRGAVDEETLTAAMVAAALQEI